MSKSSKKEQLKLLSDYGDVIGSGVGSPYEALYVLDPKIRSSVMDEEGQLVLNEFDPNSWAEIENSQIYKNAVVEAKAEALKKAYEVLNNNTDNIDITDKDKTRSKIYPKFIGSESILTKGNTMIFALGTSTIISTVLVDGKTKDDGGIDVTFTIKYNLTDEFGNIFGVKKGNLEYGKSYTMMGPKRTETLNLTFTSKKEYEKYLKQVSKR